MTNKYSLKRVLLDETHQPAKKLTARDLRSLILDESRKPLREHTIPDKDADINDMDADAVWDIMTGDDTAEAQALLDRIGSATGWGSGALQKAGVTGETLKAKAEEIFGDKVENIFPDEWDLDFSNNNEFYISGVKKIEKELKLNNIKTNFVFKKEGQHNETHWNPILSEFLSSI